MQARSILFATLMSAISLAGCTGDSVEPNNATMDDEMSDEPIPTFGPHSGLAEERPEDWAPTLDEAPQWVFGEWWDITFTDQFVGNTHEITRIAAGKEGLNNLVGMPLDEFNDDVMIMHQPGFGLIHSQTLGVEMHDFLYEPLKFPLREDDSWNSLWQGQNSVVTHTVAEVSHENMTATITQTGAQAATYTYDANMGVISNFNAPGYMTFEVLDHGFDYEGMVRVPYSHDMTMLNGRLGPATPVGNSTQEAKDSGQCPPQTQTCPASTNTETFTIREGYDRASFALLIFELGELFASGPSGGASSTSGNGYYSIQATAPDGQVFFAEKQPNQGGHVVETYFHDSPGGEWALEIVAGGPAQVFIEGITYTTFDVDLPSGCVVLTENVHDHGGECGGHVHDIE